MQTQGMTKNQPRHSEPAMPASQTFSPMPSGVRDASAASATRDATMVQASHNATSTLVDADASAHSRDREGPASRHAKGMGYEKCAEPNKKILPFCKRRRIDH
jgi:D-serine deaminase-like pyridoxal phosphate-dependent protein